MNKSTNPASDEIWGILKEVAASHKEAKQEMKELRASQKETDEQIKQSGKKLEKTISLFETQWGRLVESLIEGKLVEMLKTRGIEVRQTSQRV